MTEDELVDIEEREAIAVENLPEDVAQAAWEYRVEKAKREKEYLSDVHDPLKLSLTPKAHEIEVTYFDYNDMEMVNNVMRPKKKTAQLSTILEAVYSDAQLEPDKFSVKTIDIRKFALDAINTADTCIDKFTKIEGLYTRDKANPADVQAQVKQFVSEATKHGISEQDAYAKAYVLWPEAKQTVH